MFVFKDFSVHHKDCLTHCGVTDRPSELELASELESDLRNTVGWGRKWLVDLKAGKT